jgi:hypothetical protein
MYVTNELCNECETCAAKSAQENRDSLSHRDGAARTDRGSPPEDPMVPRWRRSQNPVPFTGVWVRSPPPAPDCSRNSRGVRARTRDRRAIIATCPHLPDTHVRCAVWRIGFRATLATADRGPQILRTPCGCSITEPARTPSGAPSAPSSATPLRPAVRVSRYFVRVFSGGTSGLWQHGPRRRAPWAV